MKSISIPINVLKAAVLCCGTSDVRYYLQGVAISSKSIVSTDGHILFNHPLNGEDETIYIVHNEDLKTLFKNLDKKHTHIDFIKLDNAYYFMCGEYRQFVSLIDGNYPDVNRVFISAERGVQASEGVKQVRMSHEYLSLIAKVTKTLKLNKHDYPFFNFSTNTEACVVTYETSDVKMYYMPCRTK